MQAGDTSILPGNTFGLGSTVDGALVTGVNYCFPDPAEECVYVHCNIDDVSDLGGITSNPSAQVSSVRPVYSAEITARVGSLAIREKYLGFTYISGGFEYSNLFEVTGSGFDVIAPGDNLNAARVVKVWDGSTLWGTIYNSFLNPGTYSIDWAWRKNRTAIFKVDNDNEVSLYYKFPGTPSNQGDFPGYRYFYNLPSCGAVVDFKTGDIYLLGFRYRATVEGFLLGDSVDGFDDGTFVRLTNKKKLETLKLKVDASQPELQGLTSEAIRSLIIDEWNYFMQLAPIT